MTTVKSKSMRVTQQDIAEAVGVSHVAVSHVLHRPHSARISPATRDEILRVARQMGYEPRKATTHTIALVVDRGGLATDVTTGTITAADEILRENGYRMSISVLDGDNMDLAPSLFNQKTVDGVIFTDWYGAESECLLKLRVPFILFADAVGLDPKIDQVALDTEDCARKMTDHLLQHGAERIAVVTGAQGIGIHERIMQGTLRALQAAGLNENHLLRVYDNELGEAVERVLLPALQQSRLRTGILATSPGRVIMAMNRLQKNGIRIPEDVSMVSITDSPRLLFLQPQVTASTALGHNTVKLVVERLISRIEGGAWRPGRQLVTGDIIERDSVVPRN